MRELLADYRDLVLVVANLANAQAIFFRQPTFLPEKFTSLPKALSVPVPITFRRHPGSTGLGVAVQAVNAMDLP